MTRTSATPDRRITADDQSMSYGQQVHDVYDFFFPPVVGDLIAERIVDLSKRYLGIESPRVAELGVGNGRVAIPLARRGVDVTGVDSSPHLLAVAAARVTEAVPGRVRLTNGDLRRWRGDSDHDVACCVCGTVSMVASDAEQHSMLEAATSSIHARGIVVVETHGPAFIRSLHGQRREYKAEIAAAGLPGLVCDATLDGANWQLSFTWQHDGRLRTATERSRVTGPDELDRIAADAGLFPVHYFSGWDDPSWPDGGDGSAATVAAAPTYVVVYRRDPLTSSDGLR
jgi:SAM-dependent methyltransferase